MTITNLHQRKITAARLAEFKDRLAELQANTPADANAKIGHRFAINQTQSYIDQFEAEITDFDELAEADLIPINDLDDIGDALIRARIASGLTQAQLGERVGLATSAINRYEASSYKTTNLSRLAEISRGLDFDLNAALTRR